MTTAAENVRGGRAHLPALDGLRGLAIALVLAHHLVSGWHPAARWLAAPVRIADVGWVGVDLFFALSGFLITGVLLDACGRPAYFRTFYVRRLLRIWPLYATVLMVLTAAALARPGMAGGEGHRFLALWPWYWTHTLNFFIARHGWGSPLATDHLWSLAIEEQFYLVWPLLVALLPRRALPRACLAVAGASLVVRAALHAVAGFDGETVKVLPFTHLDPLALGAWFASVWRDPDARARVRSWLAAARSARGRRVAITALVLVDAVVLVAVNRSASAGAALRMIAPAIIAIACVSVVAVAVVAPNGWAARALTAEPLRALGRIRYGVYALHPLLIFALTGGARVPTAHVVPLRLVAIAAAIGLAALSWRVLEQPALRLKDRWAPTSGGAESSVLTRAA